VGAEAVALAFEGAAGGKAFKDEALESIEEVSSLPAPTPSRPGGAEPLDFLSGDFFCGDKSEASKRFSDHLGPPGAVH